MSKGNELRRSYQRKSGFSAVGVFFFLLTSIVRCHIFYENRLRDIHDGITKWKGMDEESDILDDSGNLLKK